MPENFYNQDDIRSIVLEKMRELGIYPASKYQNLIVDGKLHRYQIEGRKNGKEDGAYIIHDDTYPVCFLQDWTGGEDAKWTVPLNNTGSIRKTPLDAKLWQEEQKRREAEQEERYAKAALEAEEYYQRCEAYDFLHPYLDKKHISHRYSIRIDRLKNYLVIPLYGIDGNILSVQTIAPDGTKRFYTGAKTKGAFFAIGLDELKDKTTPILLGEGVATIATVHEITGGKYPCVAAMSSGNLEAVAKDLKSRYANPIIIMADNDLKTQAKTGKNPGLDAAIKLKQAGTAMEVLAPPFGSPDDGSDWNDYAIKYGADCQGIRQLKEGILYFTLDEKQRKEYDRRKKLNSLVGLLDPSIQLPPQDFIGGLFPRGYVSAIVAAPGTGKTMFMQKVVSDLSMGGTFFDGFAENEPPRRTLIFAGEAGYEMLIRRGASFKWPVNPQNVPVVDQYKFEAEGCSIMLDTPEGWQNIKDLIYMRKPDIVFFDSLRSFHNIDDNKNDAFKPIIRNLLKLARELNIAIVLVHHTRKRGSKERMFTLSQDDAIGTSVFNQFVALIVGIEPDSDDNHNLRVKPLKSWGRYFDPFDYKITEDLYGHSMIETKLAPEDKGDSRRAVWNAIQYAFSPGEWFSISEIDLASIEGNISERLLKKIIAEFVKTGQLEKRGSTKNMEYCIALNRA